MPWLGNFIHGSKSTRLIQFGDPCTTSSAPGHPVWEVSWLGKQVQSSFTNWIIFSHSEALELLKSSMRVIHNSIWHSFHLYILLSLSPEISLHFHSLNPILFFSQGSAICVLPADKASFSFSTEKWLIYYSEGPNSSPTVYRHPLNWALNELHNNNPVMWFDFGSWNPINHLKHNWLRDWRWACVCQARKRLCATCSQDFKPRQWGKWVIWWLVESPELRDIHISSGKVSECRCQGKKMLMEWSSLGTPQELCGMESVDGLDSRSAFLQQVDELGGDGCLGTPLG